MRHEGTTACYVEACTFDEAAAIGAVLDDAAASHPDGRRVGIDVLAIMRAYKAVKGHDLSWMQ
jgi:hypothetical protein